MTAIYDAALAPVGLGVAQYGLLRKVERGGPLSLTDLSRLAELDRSTVGRNARVLAKAGLLQFDGGGDDRREARVALTDKGRDVLAQAATCWAGAQAHVEARVGADTVALLRRVADLL